MKTGEHFDRLQFDGNVLYLKRSNLGLCQLMWHFNCDIYLGRFITFVRPQGFCLCTWYTLLFSQRGVATEPSLRRVLGLRWGRFSTTDLCRAGRSSAYLGQGRQPSQRGRKPEMYIWNFETPLNIFSYITKKFKWQVFVTELAGNISYGFFSFPFISSFIQQEGYYLFVNASFESKYNCK